MRYKTVQRLPTIETTHQIIYSPTKTIYHRWVFMYSPYYVTSAYNIQNVYSSSSSVQPDRIQRFIHNSKLTTPINEFFFFFWSAHQALRINNKSHDEYLLSASDTDSSANIIFVMYDLITRDTVHSHLESSQKRNGPADIKCTSFVIKQHYLLAFNDLLT